MAISNRSRSRTSRPPSRQVPAAKEPVIDLTPAPSPVIADIDPHEPDALVETAPPVPAEVAPEAAEPAAASGSSSRRGVARASRRMSSQSSSRNPVSRKSDRILTPAEILARRQAMITGLKIGAGLILIVGCVVGLCWLAKPNPRQVKGAESLQAAQQQYILLCAAIDNRQVDQARAAYAKALTDLHVPELSNAKEPIDPNDPHLAGVKMATQAIALSKTIHEREAVIDRIERDAKVVANKTRIVDAMTDLSHLTKAQLADLDKRITLFVANPVEPDAGSPNDYQGAYNDDVNEVKEQVIQLESENARRLAAITSDQERKAYGDVNVKVKSERFNDALTCLDEYKGKFADANFEDLRTFVKESAAQAWKEAKDYADSRITDYKSPGIPEAVAKQALIDARTRMQAVVDNFGIDDYVGQAKEILNKYPQP